MKIKLKAGFRYDVEAIIGEDINIKDDFDDFVQKESKAIKEDIKRRLDFEFGGDGIISDFSVSWEKVEE